MNSSLSAMVIQVGRFWLRLSPPTLPGELCQHKFLLSNMLSLLTATGVLLNSLILSAELPAQKTWKIQTTTTGRVAGILAEPIQGVGGFITPPPEYFKIVAEIVRKYGGLFISDEVQTGFGRTGKMWGIEQYDVEPDMITAAKGIANGMPLAVVVTTSDIADALTKNTISTFGGNPVSCAAAKATINVIQRDKLEKNAGKMGKLLRDRLEQLQEKYPKVIGEVRGMGLMQAIELVVDETKKDRTPNPGAADQLMEETKLRGLLIGRGGLYANTMRISPPLNITKNEVEEAVGILDDSFAAMT